MQAHDRIKTRLARLIPVPRARRRLLAHIAHRRYSLELREAKRLNDTELIADLKRTREWDLQYDYELEEVRFTRGLLRKARHLRVPIPMYPLKLGTENAHWEFGGMAGERYLSKAGVAEVRASIRKEEEWLREQRGHWATILTAVAGIIGTLTGLIAVLHL